MNYLEKAVNSINGTYYTPKKLIDKINKEKINTIIGNPKFKNKMKKQKFRILSPDGFDIEFNKTYNSINKVNLAINNFIERYKLQGYYSSIKNGQRLNIPLNEIKNYCSIIEIN